MTDSSEHEPAVFSEPAEQAGADRASAGAAAGVVARFRALLRAHADPGTTKADCAVLGVVLDRMNAGGVSWPSLSRIAADAEVSERTAKRAIQTLVERGHLVRESGTRTTSNRYRMPVPAIGSDKPVTTGSDRHATTGGDKPVTGVVSGLSPQVVTSLSPEPASLNLSQEPASISQERQHDNAIADRVGALESAQRKRKTKIPSDWRPSDEDRAWVAHHHPDMPLDLTAHEFHSYWSTLSGKKACKLDWSLTFRKRVATVAAHVAEDMQRRRDGISAKMAELRPRGSAELLRLVTDATWSAAAIDELKRRTAEADYANDSNADLDAILRSNTVQGRELEAVELELDRRQRRARAAAAPTAREAAARPAAVPPVPAATNSTAATTDDPRCDPRNPDPDFDGYHEEMLYRMATSRAAGEVLSRSRAIAALHRRQARGTLDADGLAVLRSVT